MGAKQGRTKGNEQKAEYLESDGRHGKPDWKKEENAEAKAEARHCGSGCEAKAVDQRKRRNRS